jgi:uncharacterized protein (TIGR02145 family)
MNTNSVTQSPVYKFVFRTVLPVLASAAVYSGISGCHSNPPDANFIASSTSITAGQSVTFTDKSNPNSYDIDHWTWTFEGGTPATSTERNPTVVYAVAGVYDVTLKVSSTAGNATSFKDNFITVTDLPNPGPTAQFTASVTELYEGDTVNFTDQSTASPTSWLWTFEGGTPATSTVQNPTGIVYANPGAYDVTLVATNANGSNTLLKSEYILVLQSLPYCSPVTDIDGNTYQVLELGNHCWMASNLKTATYDNGVPIPTGLDSASWVNTTSGAYAIYDNNSANNTTYGKLYNWHAVNSPNKLCPQGWHVATLADWTDLFDSQGGQNLAGGTLSLGSSWTPPNPDATNSSGFSALAGGFRPGNYDGKGNAGLYWTATSVDATNANHLFFYEIGTYVDVFIGIKEGGMSCRCVKD